MLDNDKVYVEDKIKKEQTDENESSLLSEVKMKKLVISGKNIADKFINKFKEEIRNDHSLILDIPLERHLINKRIAALLTNKAGVLKEIKLLERRVKKQLFEEDKRNKFKSNRDIKEMIASNDDVMNIKYMLEYNNISITILERALEDVEEIRPAVNAYNNMRNSGGIV